MRYATPEAFRAALEDRLKNAQNETVGVSRLRKRVVFERLLARLAAQAAGEWVLKGGFALELRLDELSRSTKDIDVDWSLGEEDATERLLDAADLDIGDMFEFRLQRADTDEELDGGGQRWRATALLDGREFERILIDVTLAAEPIFEPDTLMSFGLLAFAGLDQVQVRTLAIEQHLAEKVHAYTRKYAGDQPSSRVKDLIDIDVIAATTPVDSDRLRTALDTIFAERATHPVPSNLRRHHRTGLALGRNSRRTCRFPLRSPPGTKQRPHSSTRSSQARPPTTNGSQKTAGNHRDRVAVSGAEVLQSLELLKPDMALAGPFLEQSPG